ncbi:MAG TPA: N-acetylglucosamine-6-phosphate deacetylase [Acidimicrobiales bacterium]|nr:N-acetylglucosamine-6-phosphate deacetylase [Acidimicrobiales bacterium]
MKSRAPTGAAGGGGRGDALLGLASQRVLLPEGPLRPAVVWIDTARGRIESVTEDGRSEPGIRDDTPHGRIVSLDDDLVLAPGFVDVHVHGGAGSQANGAHADEVESSVAEFAAFHAHHGTTSLVATTVSDSHERLMASVEGIARATGRTVSSAGRAGAARVLGCHLEGPFISLARAGAQDRSEIRPPDPGQLTELLERGGGAVRMITLAPELDGAAELISLCHDAGVVVSIGHSDADYECARRAFDAGASHVAHLFNAMAPLHQRRPGPVGAALSDETVTVELICDMHHVHPAVVSIVAAAAPERVVIVTDASAAAGMESGPVSLGGVHAVLDGTEVTLADDPLTLAGSALTMDLAVRRVVRDARIPLEHALRAASTAPARVVGGLPGDLAPLPGLGMVAAGAPADLVLLDGQLDAVATLVAGRAVFDPRSLVS